MSDTQDNSNSRPDRIEKLMREVIESRAEVKTYAGIVANHVTQQEAFNRHLVGRLDGHERELRRLTEWRAVQDATIPKALEELRDGQRATTKALAGVTNTIAKWGGVAVGVIVIVEIGIKVIGLLI